MAQDGGRHRWPAAPSAASDRRRGGRGTRRSARWPRRPGAGIAWTIIASSRGLRSVISKHDPIGRGQDRPPPPNPPDRRAAGGARRGQHRPARRGASDDVTVEPRIVEATARARLARADRRVAAGRAARLAGRDHPLDRLHRCLRRPGAGLDRARRGRLAARARPRAGDSASRCRSASTPGTRSAPTISAPSSARARSRSGPASKWPSRRPWLARLMFMGPTRTLVRDVVLELPIQTGAVVPRSAGAHRRRPRRRGAARRRDVAGHRPQSPARPQRDGRSATAGPSPASPPATPSRAAARADARERRAAGVWWSPAVFCTTREAIEPWRFDVADATALQLGGARLRRDRGAVRIAAHADRPAARPSISRRSTRCCRRPPSASSTRWSTAGPAACGSPTATPTSNLVCLQVVDASASGPPRRRRQPARPPGDAHRRRRRRGVLAGAIARRRVDVGHAGAGTTGCASPRRSIGCRSARRW